MFSTLTYTEDCGTVVMLAPRDRGAIPGPKLDSMLGVSGKVLDTCDTEDRNTGIDTEGKVTPDICEDEALFEYGNDSENKLDSEAKCPKLVESVADRFSVVIDRAGVRAVDSKETVNSNVLASVFDANRNGILDEDPIDIWDVIVGTTNIKLVISSDTRDVVNLRDPASGSEANSNGLDGGVPDRT